MKLVFLPSTLSDLAWMRSYYTQVFPDGARRAAEQYRRASRIVRDNPLVGHPVEDIPNVREFSIPRTPFSFIYRLGDDRIEVLRVWDQRGDRSSSQAENTVRRWDRADPDRR